MWSVWSCLGAAAAAAAAGLGWAGLPTHYIVSVKSCKWHGSMTPPGRRAAGEMFMGDRDFSFPPYFPPPGQLFFTRPIQEANSGWRGSTDPNCRGGSLGYVTSLKAWLRRPSLVRMGGRFSDFLCNFFSLLFCLLLASYFPSPPSSPLL